MRAASCTLSSQPATAGVACQRRAAAAAPAASAARVASSSNRGTSEVAAGAAAVSLDRRALLGAAVALAVSACQPPAWAVQGLTAGRIPGVSGPDADGLYTYTRPEGKSGGHGVGWSEIQRYSFKVPKNWEETPVSIADLGGTEIDLRYSNPDEGSLQVVVAPVARFKSVGINANITIEDLASPQNIIAGFAPELYGRPLQTDDDALDAKVVTKDGLIYYIYELKQHRLVAATATGNRLYMLATKQSSLQWRKHGGTMLMIRDSFSVPPSAKAVGLGEAE